MDLSSLAAVAARLRALEPLHRLAEVERVLRWVQAEKEAALTAVRASAGSDRAVCAAVATTTGSSGRAAERQLHEAHALSSVAPTLQALEAGEITRAAAVATATTLDHLPSPLASSLADRAIDEVLRQHGDAAQTRHFQQAAQRLAAEHTSEEAQDARFAAAHAARSVDVRALPDGMALVSWSLRADRAQAVYDVLTRRARVLVDRDDPRDPGWDARRSDELYRLVLGTAGGAVEATGSPAGVRSGSGAGDDGGSGSVNGERGARPVVRTVTHWVHTPVDGPAFLDGGQVLPPAVTAELTQPCRSGTAGEVARVVQRVVHVDRAGRIADPPPPHDPYDRGVTPRLRTWIALRDRTCRFPGCGVPARLCELDHLVAWVDGGLSTPENLACLCSSHHRGSKHSTRWTVTGLVGRGANGLLLWAGPGGQRHTTRPGVLSPPRSNDDSRAGPPGRARPPG